MEQKPRHSQPDDAASTSSGQTRISKRLESKRTAETKPGCSKENVQPKPIGRPRKNPGEIRRARSTADIRDGDSTTGGPEGRSRSAGPEWEFDFIRRKPTKEQLKMMQEISFKMTRDAFLKAVEEGITRKAPPGRPKPRQREPKPLPASGTSPTKTMAGPNFQWTFKQSLPKDFYENIPENARSKPGNPALKWGATHSVEECRLLDALLVHEMSTMFNDNSNEDDDDEPETMGEEDGVKDDEVLSLETLEDQIIEHQIEKTLDREYHFRQRNQAMKGLQFHRTAHHPRQRIFHEFVAKNDFEGFIMKLEYSMMNLERCEDQGVEPWKARGILHMAAELNRQEFVEQLLGYYSKSTDKSIKEQIPLWFSDLDKAGLLPFQNALLTNFEDRFKMAQMLLSHVDLKILQSKCIIRSGLLEYKETVLDVVISAGHTKFIYFYLKQINVTTELKESAILPIVCSGDTHLLRYVWNIKCETEADKSLFCRANSEKLEKGVKMNCSGCCSDSPIMTAVDRGDINMVATILDIYPEAITFTTVTDGLLLWQYATVVGAPQEMVNLLRSRSQYGFDHPMRLTHVMKTALRYKNRSIYDEGIKLCSQIFENHPHYTLPGLLRYSYGSQFYDITADILNMCLQKGQLRNNLRDEMVRLFILVMADRKRPQDVMERLIGLLEKNGVNANIVGQYIALEAERCRNDKLEREKRKQEQEKPQKMED